MCIVRSLLKPRPMLFSYANELKIFGLEFYLIFLGLLLPMLRFGTSSLANCLSVEEFLVFGISCWAIWNDRNALNRKEEICPIDTKVSGFSLMLPR